MATAALSTISLNDRAAQEPAPWGWRCACAALMGVAAVVALSGAWVDIAGFATSEESSHIIMVPFVVAWLVFVRRPIVALVRPTSSWWGLALVVLGWAVAHVGFTHSIQCFWHGGAVLMLLGCLVSVLGVPVLRALWPVVPVLGFLVPVPVMVRLPLAAHLQSMTAAATAKLMSTFGMAVTQYGNQVVVNGFPVSVVEGCNGLRLVFPLFLVVYAFCFSLPLRGWLRAALILASPLVAVACNILRLVPTVWLFGHASTETAQRFHDVSGWCMIAVAFLLLLGLVKILELMKVPVMVKGRKADTDA